MENPSDYGNQFFCYFNSLFYPDDEMHVKKYRKRRNTEENKLMSRDYQQSGSGKKIQEGEESGKNMK
jgi:hypothetical protein